MATRLLLTDWNGTAFTYPTDKELNRSIAYAELRSAVKGLALTLGLSPKYRHAFGRLLKTKGELKKRLAEYEAGGRPLSEVYEPFNSLVLAYMTPEKINRLIDKFAEKNA